MEYLCRGLVLIKLQAFRSATLLKRDYSTGACCDYCELFKNTYFKEHLRTAASVYSKICWNIRKWVLLNRASSSTQLPPPPPSSFQPPPSSFQPPPSSLQHPQQYLNQNIARNWAIFPNLGQKTKSCPFWLKIGTYCILEVLIPNPGLDFWNSDPKTHFWENLGPKI